VSKELSADLADRLKKAHIHASGYARSPIRGAGFIVNRLSQDLIKLWATEEAKIEMHLSKKHRQAAISVHEGERTLTRRGSATIYVSKEDGTDVGSVRKAIIKTWRQHNPITVPNARRSTAVLAKTDQLKKIIERGKEAAKIHGSAHPYRITVANVPIEHRATVAAQDVHLLLGIDEVAHFICALPEKPESVTHAHEILRPKNLKNGTVRVSKAVAKKLNQHLQKNSAHWSRDLRRNGIRPSWLERRSSHFATSSLRFENKLYVIGCVLDTRSSHHEPLMLNGWHEVIRNREIVMPNSNTGRTQYWD
jgi:hypothetical protein